MSQFNATFSNADGLCRTVLSYEKGLFRMRLTHTLFEGKSLEAMKLKSNPSSAFQRMQEGEILRNFQLIFKVPLPQASEDEFLAIKAKINQENKIRRYQHNFEAQLYTDQYVFKTQEQHHSLRSALEELKDKRPDGYPLHICFFCALSDFHPQDTASFGRMRCFKAQAEAYLQSDYLDDLENLLEQKPPRTTELSGCEDFRERMPGQDFIVN